MTCPQADAAATNAGGPFVMGVYPMLQDETCFFLAIDFDKSTWRVDASAFLDSGEEREAIPARGI